MRFNTILLLLLLLLLGQFVAEDSQLLLMRGIASEVDLLLLLCVE